MSFPYRYANTDIVGQSELITGSNGLVIHQPSTGAMEGVKAWLDKKSYGLPVANKYLVAGAAIAAIGYYGYTHRWF